MIFSTFSKVKFGKEVKLKRFSGNTLHVIDLYTRYSLDSLVEKETLCFSPMNFKEV